MIEMIFHITRVLPWPSIEFVEARLSKEVDSLAVAVEGAPVDGTGAGEEGGGGGVHAEGAMARGLNAYQLGHDCMRLLYTLLSSGEK